MAQQVNGFLAADGTFFEKLPECRRHEASREIEGLCESHGINFDNFIATLNAWQSPIREYYDADDDCGEKQVTNGATPSFEEPLSPFEEDRADPPSRDKDAPGFLEQQVRRNK
jgi:hypothetical protein